MKSTENEILNELEHLLRNADPEDFLRAGKHKNISKHLKSALEFMALDALEKTSELKNSNAIEYYRQSSHVFHLDKKHTPLHPSSSIPKNEANRIYEVLINSKRFANKTAMMNLVNHLGLRVAVKNKDSLDRTAKKLAKAIVLSPEQIKKSFLSMINENLDDQTKGWFDIIRSK